MLKNLVRKNRRLFEAIAQSWIDEGAGGFVIQATSDKKIAAWPSETTIDGGQKGVMTAEIMAGGQSLGSLNVVGVNGPVNLARLKHEALLLDKWLSLEREINSVTSQLIEYQDQILLLYELSQSARHHLQREPTIRSYLATGRQLLQVEQLILIEGSPTPESDEEVSIDQFNLISDPEPRHPSPARDELLVRLHLSSQSEEGHRPLADLPEEGWRHVMALPVHGRLNGVATLIAINRQLGRFDTPTQKMGAALVDLLGSELERLALHQQILAKTRLETEAAMARTVQMQLFPRSAPSVEGIDVFGAAKPALQVGGDYYDFIKLSDQELFFTLADVSGKGMPAALSMTNLRSAIRTAVQLLPTFDVQNVLRHTNDSLYEDFADVEMFATIFCGAYSFSEQKIRFSNGGHAPVIYKPAIGQGRMLLANGPALGVMQEGSVGYGELPFGPGDVLVAATDGFNEAENETGEMFGYDRLIAFIEDNASLSAAALAQQLIDEVVRFRGDEPQQDDQTIVVLKGLTTETWKS